MREILFRGKGTCGLNAGDWIYGYYVKDFWKPTRCGCGIIPIDKERGGYCEVNPSTIGQYTGLTDKNGKKIFEGDILHCTARLDSANMVVIYENAEFRLVPCERYKTYTTGMGYRYFGCLDTEVIGNIHDNPELSEIPNG